MAAARGVAFACLALGLILDGAAIPVKFPGVGEFVES